MMAHPQPEPTTPHEHALAYAALGLRTLPIRAGGKAPPFKSWQHAATNDPDKIDNWFKGLYRDCGVGIALGDQPNGWHLFALDLDNHGDGDGTDELAELEAKHGALPDTWRAITGSGGVHLIFRVPEGVTVRNQQATGNRVAPNIDVRGQGGQIVVAPTLHPETLNAYAWEHGFEPWALEPAIAPRWLLDMVREPDPTPEPTTPPPAPSSSDDTVFELQRNDWNWHVELVALGWQQDQRNPERWTRPGKDPRQGHSAILHGDGGPFVVFTTEIPHEWRNAGKPTVDGSGWSFGPFGFYAATRHAGDRSAAAKALSERYGIEPASLDELVAETGVEGDDGAAADDPDQRLRDMLIDWAEFANTDHNAATWLWEPVIPAGRATAIFAKGGTGKSLVVLRMVVDLVRQGVKVLYLDYEMTPDDLDDRLTDMGVEDPTEFTGTLFYAQLPPLDPLDTGEGGRDIRRLAQIADAELVVIDTFARAVEGDENDADTVRKFYSMTGLHLKADGRAFVRVDHAGKDGTKGQRGSSAKNDDVDLVWELKRTEDGYQMVRGKCRMGWVPENVALERSNDPLEIWVKGGPSYVPGTSEMAATLDQLEIDVALGYRKVRAALKDAGEPAAKNDVLRDAQKYRRARSQTYHFVDDLVVDNSAKSAGRTSGRTPSEGERGAPRGAPTGDSANPQVDDSGRTSGRTGAHPTDATGAQCAPLYGAHAPSVNADETDQPPTTLEEIGL